MAGRQSGLHHGDGSTEMSGQHDHDGPHEHDLGLSDLPRLLSPRRVLSLLGVCAAGTPALAGCGGGDEGTATAATPISAGATADVQAADADGRVTFTTVYPAAYQGRWPHIHFEVYGSLAAATAAGDKLRTSQLALPEDASAAVYATDGYEQSVRNLAQTSLATDNVFADGCSLELAKVTGSVDGGYTATLTVPV